MRLLAVMLGCACAPGPGGGGTGGGAGSSLCSPACGQGRTCCQGVCVNANNDPKNCGACGTTCPAAQFCGDGRCQAPGCTVDGGSCPGGAACCGAACCAAGQLCCSLEGPVSRAPECVAPVMGTCPQGCAPLCISDRAAKTGLVKVDERQVLERVSELPISTWSYTFDPSGTRHIGPMAQDFYDAFSLGESDRSYDPIDAHGVSLASIKALAAMVEEQRLRLDRLEAENAALRQRICR